MPWYLAVFAVITVYLAVSNTLVQLNAKEITGWMALQYVVTGELIRAGAAALIASPIITEAAPGTLAGSPRHESVVHRVVYNISYGEPQRRFDFRKLLIVLGILLALILLAAAAYGIYWLFTDEDGIDLAAPSVLGAERPMQLRQHRLKRDITGPVPRQYQYGIPGGREQEH
ncbi:hypothetical protein GBAR_LOCUS31213 [Geodia barretti]|uniref:Uncharacterized protein n=1 Tax=Geodia barretti TaxID=519541 RepID=A0AA35TZ99_GEOBA|nr:hypothetical protein GBAR_LOCUS31213 [Geodia barretti]